MGGCGKEVVIKLEDDEEEREREESEASGSEDQGWREDAQQQLIEKYADMITTEHDGGCLWRRRGCDGNYDLVRLGTSSTNVDSRYNISSSSRPQSNYP